MPYECGGPGGVFMAPSVGRDSTTRSKHGDSCVASARRIATSLQGAILEKTYQDIEDLSVFVWRICRCFSCPPYAALYYGLDSASPVLIFSFHHG